MEFTATQIPEVIVIDPVVYEDARGFFMDTWQEQKFHDAGIDARFVQDSHSRSSHGALRGLHYQVSQPQGKLIRVIHGEAFDVAVDIRQSSPTFELRAEKEGISSPAVVQGLDSYPVPH